ncbi:MAG: hypothetical protein WCW04_01685 [Candidatus Paceibacterota bacterium]
MKHFKGISYLLNDDPLRFLVYGCAVIFFVVILIDLIRVFFFKKKKKKNTAVNKNEDML